MSTQPRYELLIRRDGQEFNGLSGWTNDGYGDAVRSDSVGDVAEALASLTRTRDFAASEFAVYDHAARRLLHHVVASVGFDEAEMWFVPREPITQGARDMNNRELTIRGLTACGFTQTRQTAKYLVFTATDDARTYFLGRSGGLRMSRTGTFTGSLSLTGCAGHKAFKTVGDPSYRFESVTQAREVWTTALRTLAGTT
jgi:hypothetical protein